MSRVLSLPLCSGSIPLLSGIHFKLKQTVEKLCFSCGRVCLLLTSINVPLLHSISFRVAIHLAQRLHFLASLGMAMGLSSGQRNAMGNVMWSF